MAKNLLTDADSMCYFAGSCATLPDTHLFLDNMIREIISDCGSNKITGWVEKHGGKANFRNHVATTLPYKDGRSTEKPEFLNEAKDYLVEQYGFKWATWLESEDLVLIAAKKLGYSHCIICGYDKDLLQVPCTFYNYKQAWKKYGKRMVTLSQDEADYNLYEQFLTGDKNTDNIPGLYGIGPAKAGEILSCDRSTWPRAVAMAYIEQGHSYQYLLEQCRLIYLLREMNEVFMFPLTAEEYAQLEEEHSNG